MSHPSSVFWGFENNADVDSKRSQVGSSDCDDFEKDLRALEKGTFFHMVNTSRCTETNAWLFGSYKRCHTCAWMLMDEIN